MNEFDLMIFLSRENLSFQELDSKVMGWCGSVTLRLSFLPKGSASESRVKLSRILRTCLRVLGM